MQPLPEISTVPLEVLRLHHAEVLSWNEQIEEYYGIPADGPLEVLRNPTHIDSVKHALRVGVIALAEACVDIGLLYAGERVFGPDHRGLPNVSRSYKGRTQVDNAERAAYDAHRRMLGIYVKGEDDKRTKIGKPLSEASLDELPNVVIHLLTGDLKWFGKTRQPQAEEMVGKLFLDACASLEVSPLEVSRLMVTGLFNHIATLNGRVLDARGMLKFVESTITPADLLASKNDRIKATFSKDFIRQTASSASTRQTNLSLLSELFGKILDEKNRPLTKSGRLSGVSRSIKLLRPALVAQIDERQRFHRVAR